MWKSYLKNICYVTLILISLITLGCSSHGKVLYSVPLCNCSSTTDRVRGSDIDNKYVCEETAGCVKNHGLDSQWMPAN